MARNRETNVSQMVNARGDAVASDGRPVFYESTGESRQQFLARIRGEKKAALLADLAASMAADTTAVPSTAPTKE